MSVLLCADISCETSVTSERASLLTARTLPICHVDKSCDQCYSGVRRLLESCTVTAARYGAGGYTEFRHWIPAWPGRFASGGFRAAASVTGVRGSSVALPHLGRGPTWKV